MPVNSGSSPGAPPGGHSTQLVPLPEDPVAVAAPAVEVLMQRYFLSARTVQRAVKRLLERATEGPEGRRARPVKAHQAGKWQSPPPSVALSSAYALLTRPGSTPEPAARPRSAGPPFAADGSAPS